MWCDRDAPRMKVSTSSASNVSPAECSASTSIMRNRRGWPSAKKNWADLSRFKKPFTKNALNRKIPTINSFQNSSLSSGFLLPQHGKQTRPNNNNPSNERPMIQALTKHQHPGKGRKHQLKVRERLDRRRLRKRERLYQQKMPQSRDHAQERHPIPVHPHHGVPEKRPDQRDRQTAANSGIRTSSERI